jgi:hypothetical protein
MQQLEFGSGRCTCNHQATRAFCGPLTIAARATIALAGRRRMIES